VECVAINDLGSVEANAHLFRYEDHHHRQWPHLCADHRQR
jgi:glyceraldehyde-3-phosphate dehydrogenase/erythrose-4-phosphate dehydrogenase